MFSIEPDKIEINFLKEHKIVETAEENETVKYLRDHEGLVFGYELMNKEFDPVAINAK